MSKNVVKKCQTKLFFKTPFWDTSKNQRLDLYEYEYEQIHHDF